MVKKCNPEQILNPETKRCIDKNGKLAKLIYKKHIDGKVEMLESNVIKMKNDKRDIIGLDNEKKKKIKKRGEDEKKLKAFNIIINNNNANEKKMDNNGDINEDNILHILELSNKASFDINIKPEYFVLPNRVGYGKYVDISFKSEYLPLEEGDCVKKDKTNKSLFYHQSFIKDYMQYASPYRGVLLYHLLGSGKCFILNTPILMFDGSIKKVQDIIPGDILMGDDSTPRNVLSLGRGKDTMYDINQSYGDKYTVNSDHIICLRNEESKKYINISVKDYLQLSICKKLKLKGYKNAISFRSKKLYIHPYIIGIWLSIGYVESTNIKCKDTSLINYISNILSKENHSLELLENDCYAIRGGGNNNLQQVLIHNKMWKEKHIGDLFKINCYDTRLKILASIIDCNGYYKEKSYIIDLCCERLCDDTIYVARSLGFAACKRIYTVFIWGIGLNTIPVKNTPKDICEEMDPLIVDINVKSIGSGNYYGFKIDGNHKFMLGDFTVTHNTSTSIAAAEILLNKKDVCVLLPASLRENFINEIKDFGNMFYKKEQYWVFVENNKILNKLNEVVSYLNIDRKIIDKCGGLWVPYKLKDLPSNFKKLSKEKQMQINLQIENIITNRYNFIHYNGLSAEKLDGLSSYKNRNIFDNKCVIVDEIHNLVSRINNKTKIGRKLYNMLYESKNSKILFLSGTPIINEPHEISIIINLLTGPRVKYYIPLKNNKIEKNDLQKILSNNMHIDYYEIIDGMNEKGIEIHLLPSGFSHIDNNNIKIARFKDNIEIDELLNDITTSIKKWNPSKIRSTLYKTLPEDKNEFAHFFINNKNLKVKNSQLFMKRISGCVSYYNTTPYNLYPKFSEPQLIYLEMSDRQFQEYVECRNKEIKNEKRHQQNHDKNKNYGRLYRFYSRACCNFVFPKDIPRPKPPLIKNNIDLDQIEYDSEIHDPIIKEKGDMQITLYKRDIKKKLDLLENDPFFLSMNGLKTHSPKFFNIIEKINNLKGTALIYSQFKVLEGLGILELTLEKNGYTRFSLKKKDSVWNINFDEKKKGKHKFIILNPKDEESKILLKIFNNELNEIPDNIAKQFKDKNNITGDIIKIALITQSGAEGISLKNVRQVHILEPYWNKIRIDQVIGRAIRTCSHHDLPFDERYVNIYIYMMTLNNNQKKQFKNKVKEMETTDQYIYESAKLKNNLIEQILQLLQKASIDCVHNAKLHNKNNKEKNPHSENITCFSYPVNLPDNSITLNDDIYLDTLDEQYLPRIKPEVYIGKIKKTQNGKFIVNPTTNQVYDHDIYIETGKLDCIGTLENNKIFIDP